MLRKHNKKFSDFFPDPLCSPYFGKLWANRWSYQKSEAAMRKGNFMQNIWFFMTFCRQTHRLAAMLDYV